MQKRTKPLDFEYPRKLQFACDRCTICCGDTTQRIRSVVLMPVEAQLISDYSGKKIEDFAQEKNLTAPYTHVIKKKSDGKCVFLSKDTCVIYEKRPLVCRFYPFELGIDPRGKHIFSYTRECPCIGNGVRLPKKYFADLFEQSRRTMGENRQFFSNRSLRS